MDKGTKEELTYYPEMTAWGDDELQGKQVFKRPKHMPKDSGGKLDLDEPTRSHSSLRKAKKVDSKPNDGSDSTQPTTKYKGLAFTVKVPNYVDG